MAVYNHRVQIVLTGDQHEHLLYLATAVGKPVSVLIREAVEVVYFSPKLEAERLEALEELLTLNAPAIDWSEMEAEIIRGVSND